MFAETMVSYWNGGTSDLPDFSDMQRYVSDYFSYVPFHTKSLPSQYPIQAVDWPL